jgi:hypothetical protein
MKLDANPIFIHAWWRSGSTYVWSKLREDESRRCYYEPLHEKIAALNLTKINEAPDINLVLAFGHPATQKHYFAEYAELLQSNSLRYFIELAYDRYLLLPSQEDDRLYNYLSELISSASAANRKPILCFCRSQMRSAWMKSTFGGIHIAQIRNPASQWASFQIDPYFSSNMIFIALKLRDLCPGAFAHIEPFERLAQSLSERPSLPIEMISKYFVGEFVARRDCIDVFLVIWIASALQALACCDYLLDIDLLSTDLSYRKITSQWFDSVRCSADFSDCSLPTNTQPHVNFERALEDVAKAIRSSAAALVIADPAVVRKWLPSLSPLSRRVLNLALGVD